MFKIILSVKIFKRHYFPVIIIISMLHFDSRPVLGFQNLFVLQVGDFHCPETFLPLVISG